MDDLRRQLSGEGDAIEQEAKRIREYDQRKRATDPMQQKRPDDQPATDAELNAASRLVLNKLNVMKRVRHPQVGIQSAKDLLWRIYRDLVFAETGKKLTTLEPQQIPVFRNFVHWLILDEEGEWDIRKSLYVWGDLGVGKTTMVKAGQLLMQHYADRLRWTPRHFNFTTMADIFREAVATKNLGVMERLKSGVWAIDEIREEHLSIKHFGNDIQIIPMILEDRHNAWKRGTATILTSNIPPKRLKQVLNDDRLHDRIRQQYVDVHLSGKNKR